MTHPTEVNSKFAREAWIRALERTAAIDQLGITLPGLIDSLAHRFGAAPALRSESAANDVFESDDEPASLARVEWEHIHTVLLDCRGNISEAARVLGLHRRSLQRKLRRLGPPLESAGRSR